ncbi:MAG: DUF4280 domain-containing protein [Myxococcales bacterium]|nr:DUF4280 domain-containing protein [Myxococcales bacterium]
MQCNKLSSCAESTLVIASGFFDVEGQPVATVHHHIASVNIMPFPGKCLTDHQPCAPDTPSPWSPGESSTWLTSLFPIVAVDSTLQCNKCGTIRITNPGQATLSADSPLVEPEVDSARELLGAVVAVGAGAIRGVQSGVNAIPSIAGKALPFAGKLAGGVVSALVLAKLRKEGYEHLGSQVAVKTKLSLRHIDHLVRDPKTGEILAIEVKSGGAVRSAKQLAKDTEMERKGAEIVGKNAHGDLKGQSLQSKTEVRN